MRSNDAICSEEAREAVAGDGEPAGTLVVGTTPSLSAYRRPRLLRRFGSKFPRVRLTFRPTPHAELEGRVADGSLDVAFLLERSWEDRMDRDVSSRPWRHPSPRLH